MPARNPRTRLEDSTLAAGALRARYGTIGTMRHNRGALRDYRAGVWGRDTEIVRLWGSEGLLQRAIAREIGK